MRGCPLPAIEAGNGRRTNRALAMLASTARSAILGYGVVGNLMQPLELAKETVVSVTAEC